MIHDIFFEKGHSITPCYTMYIDEDLKVQADVDAECFTDALDNIADDLSEWICRQVARWLFNAREADEINDERAKQILRELEKVRP